MNNFNEKMKLSLKKILPQVQKPARYLGQEINSLIKEEPLVKIGLSYPDLYEIGMSNNGIKILYERANQIKEVAAERVFAVAPDFEKKLREEQIPLYTLETFTPLKDLDLLGFNVAHELLYTNILQILDLGQITLERKKRKETEAIIIAGGEAVGNPFPLFDFVDAFTIGDGEDLLKEIINILLEGEKKSYARETILKKIGQLEGVLLPDNYQISYKENQVAKIVGPEVTKRIYKTKVPSDPWHPLVPNIRIAQERMVLEIAKGCPNLCRFCQAGYYNLPYRPYSEEDLIKSLDTLIKNTGYDSLTLSSLSISDYPKLPVLLNNILPFLNERGISISLPSLRVDKKNIPIIENISDLRKTSLTFAVESASEKIREKANKNLSINDLIETLEYFFQKGWEKIKLYFMLGLPGSEQENEGEEIIKLLKKISQIGGPKKEINVTLSPFVPKAHTPFQREKQLDFDYLSQVIQAIKKAVPSRIKIKNHDIYSSLLEGLLARGNPLLGKVILKTYLDGNRFDSWKEYFNFAVWKKNLDELIPNWSIFLETKGETEILPWEKIKTGYEKIIDLAGQKNIPCQKNRDYADPLDLGQARANLQKFMQKYESKNKIYIHFKKENLARFIPHLDFIEIIKRSLRRAEFPVSFTQGFNKREKITLGYPLPLGIESQDEICTVDLYEDLSENHNINNLNQFLPQGIKVTELYYPKKTIKSLMAITSLIEYEIKITKNYLWEKIKNNLSQIEFFKKETKRGDIKRIPFKEIIHSYELQDNLCLLLKLYTGQESSLRIDKVIFSLADTDLSDFYNFQVVKKGQFYEEDNQFFKINFS